MYLRRSSLVFLLFSAAASPQTMKLPEGVLPQNFEFPGGKSDNAPLPRRQAPDGFQSQDVGTGRLLASPFRGAAKSAKMVLRGYLQAMAGYFDGAPTVTGGAVDNQDRRVQALISARMQGVPVAGLMSVILDNGAGSVTILIDRPERIKNTLAAAQQQGGGQNGGARQASRYENGQWVGARASDGSSTIQVPQGWNARGQNGTWDIDGPEGESIAIGVSMQYIAPSPGMSHPSTAAYMDPMRAFQFTYSKIGASAIQILEATQTQSVSGNGPAYFLLAKLTLRGTPYYAWGLSSSSPTSSTTWIHYFTMLLAPQAVFAREFGTMRKVWGSWSVSQALINQRMQAALNAMHETNAIISQTQQELSQGRARLNHAWGTAFQNNTYVQNTQTGQNILTKNIYINQVVDEMNRQEGAKVWRELPTAEYPTR